jgi:MFS family permease
MRKPSLLIIFLTVFIDLIGFGIVLPLLPIYSRNFGASGFMIGAIIAAYSVMQFLFAPAWGRLSDRIGRRPVLLVSIAGSVFSYALFAVGSTLTGSAALGLLMISRLLAGICGANITVAQAYIADITPPEKRSQRMGLIGMAFGLGFIFGPALGGIGLKFFGLAGPGWLAAGLCALNLVLAVSILPESWKPGAAGLGETGQRPRLAQWHEVLGRPRVGLLVGVFFLATFCFACFETTLGLLVGQNFDLDPTREQDAARIVYLYSFCGVIGALVQGGAIGRIVRRLGEPAVICLSLVLVGVSLIPMPFMKAWTPLLLTLSVLSVGSSLTRPPLFGLLSNLTSASEQGLTLGVAQSAGSLARIAGPVCAGTLFHFHPVLVYAGCGGVSILTAAMVWRGLCRSPGRSGN